MASTVNLLPDGNGTYDDWNPNPAVDHYLNVDDPVGNPDDDTTVVGEWLNNKKDSYTLSATGLSGSDTINHITVYVWAKQIAAPALNFRIILYVNGSDYDNGSDISTTSSYASYNNQWTENPDTSSAWTAAELDSLEVGVRTMATSPGAYVSQVYVVVDYTAGVVGPPTGSLALMGVGI